MRNIELILEAIAERLEKEICAKEYYERQLKEAEETINNLLGKLKEYEK